MTDAPFWAEPLTGQAARIASGEVTAEAATEAALARIYAVNGDLNAVVEDCAEEARATAAALDAQFASAGPVGPLHGVPVTIKINVDQKGYPNSNGVPALKGAIAPGDSPVVANLRKAGAVIVGRTNTPEFSFRADTDNPLYGRTFNPWDREISAGGSSGGAGVAVMTGMCALAHGNDIGGSLRFPAAAVGAATIKPGLGRIPVFNPGQTEERGMLAQAMSTQGPLCRRAADLRPALAAMIAPDARDPFHAPIPFRGPPLERPIRVAYSEEMFGFDLHPAFRSALRAARAALEVAGYEVVEAAPRELAEGARLGYRAILTETQHMLGPAIEAHGSDTVRRIFASYHREFPLLNEAEFLRALAKRTYYARIWSEFLDAHPLFLCPFLPGPFFAANRDAEGVEGVRDVLGVALYSYIVNFIGLPSGVVSAGWAEGRPAAVQIVGRRWREDAIIDALEVVERAAGAPDVELRRRMAAD